ncbi:MAG: hypothetical protein ABJL67_16820 [Sulfitobacter sp.]
MIRAAILLSLAMASGATACPMPSGAIPLTSQTPHAPVAFAQMDALPLSAPFALTISICDATTKANSLAFDAHMPAHQHGMNFTVDVAKIANNRFEVSNVVFHMPGLWEIRVIIEVSGHRYAYVADVPLG